MKKPTLLTTVAWIVFAQIGSHAQGIYIGLEAGYGFPSQVQVFPYNGVAISGSFTTVTSQSYSLGSGVGSGIYGGYMITKRLGIELGISNKFSSQTKSSQESIDSGFGVHASTDNYTLKGSLFRLTPAIRIVVGDGKLQTYMVTGLIIGFPTVNLEDNGTSTIVTTFSGHSTTSNYIVDQVWAYSGGMIIGFHGAVGVMYNLTDKIGIFGELSGDFQNWAPGQNIVTKVTVNGTDQLSGWTTSMKQTNYVSTYTINLSSYTPWFPTQSTQVYMPFSSFSINIGVHINLGGGGGGATSPK